MTKESYIILGSKALVLWVHFVCSCIVSGSFVLVSNFVCAAK